jgi:hypothetical protein
MDFFAHDDDLDTENPTEEPHEDDLFMGVGEDGEDPLDEKKELDDLGLHIAEESPEDEF